MSQVKIHVLKITPLVNPGRLGVSALSVVPLTCGQSFNVRGVFHVKKDDDPSPMSLILSRNNNVLSYFNFTQYSCRVEPAIGEIPMGVYEIILVVNILNIEPDLILAQNIHGNNQKVAFLIRNHGERKIFPLDENISITGGSIASRLPLLIVGGAPKSGTTWLQHILNSHPEILIFSESGFYQHPEIDSLMAIMNQGPLPNYSHAMPYFLSPDLQAANLLSARVQLIMQSYLSCTNFKWVGDRTPANEKSILYTLELFPLARLIAIERDVLDLLVSRIFHDCAIAKESKINSGVPDFLKSLVEIETFGVDEKITLEIYLDNSSVSSYINGIINEAIYLRFAARQALDLHPTRVMVVSYEQLLVSFEDVTRKIFHFLGLDTSESLLRDVLNSTKFEHMSGAKRGETYKNSFFRKAEPGDGRIFFDQGLFNFLTENISEKLKRATDA